MKVDELLEQAKGRTGRERLRAMTRVYDEMNMLPDIDGQAQRVGHALFNGDLMPEGESLGMESGLWWLVVATPFGHRCGYVRVPDGHPWAGLRYWDRKDGVKRRMIEDGPMAGAPDYGDPNVPVEDEIRRQIAVHGDLSYSDWGPVVVGAPEGWWFGFDCAHPSDLPDPAIDLLKLRNRRFTENAEIRSNAYVRGQCEALARQLAAWV